MHVNLSPFRHRSAFVEAVRSFWEVKLGTMESMRLLKDHVTLLCPYVLTFNWLMACNLETFMNAPLLVTRPAGGSIVSSAPVMLIIEILKTLSSLSRYFIFICSTTVTKIQCNGNGNRSQVQSTSTRVPCLFPLHIEPPRQFAIQQNCHVLRYSNRWDLCYQTRADFWANFMIYQIAITKLVFLKLNFKILDDGLCRFRTHDYQTY